MRSLSKDEVDMVTGGYDSVSTISPTTFTTTHYTTYVNPFDPYTVSAGGGSAGGGDLDRIANALAADNSSAAAVNAAETSLAAGGLYNGLTIATASLTAVASSDGAVVYADQNGALYGDRDGDGAIDTGILISDGVASLDLNCDGIADQTLTSL